MERITINNTDDLKAFIEAQKVARQHACAVFIASRTALRVAPDALNDAQFNGSASEFEVFCLHICRVLLISSILSSKLNIDDRTLKSTLLGSNRFIATRRTLTDKSFAAASAAVMAISGRFAIASIAAQSAARNAETSMLAVYQSSVIAHLVWAEISHDCALWIEHADRADGTLYIDFAPLWSDKNLLEPQWRVVRNRLLDVDTTDERGANWSFWVKWYDYILAGNPQNWNMLHEIATTDAIEWNASAREVNVTINQIVERYRLRNEVVALRREVEEARAVLARRAQRSHNMPPELVDEIPEIEERLTIVWAAAQEAENELEKTKPDPTILSKFAKIILDFGIWFTKYCGDISNFALKAVITAGVSSASVYYLKNDTHLIAELGKQLMDFVSRLGVF